MSNDNSFFNRLARSLKEGIDNMRKDIEIFNSLTEQEKILVRLLEQVVIDSTGRIDPETNDIDLNKRSWPIRSSLHREIRKELKKCGIQV